MPNISGYAVTEYYSPSGEGSIRKIFPYDDAGWNAALDYCAARRRVLNCHWLVSVCSVHLTELVRRVSPSASFARAC